MKIGKVRIENFRRLKNIDFTFKDGINTIVGPNGVGKSSILDALRVVKAVLSPNQLNEPLQTLQNMGIASPATQQLYYENIAGDATKPCLIECEFKLSNEEIEFIKENINEFNISRLQRNFGLQEQNRINIVGFLSSKEGQERLGKISEDTTKEMEKLEKTRSCLLSLTFNPNRPIGKNGFQQEIIAFILTSTNFSKSLFSVFPADRSFPMGDVNIQIGHNEISQQVQSYSINPQLKFQRLKSFLISYLLIHNSNLDELKSDFKLIFENLIRGKELMGVSLDERTGKLSVAIRDVESGYLYDIDFLSSGEKGLLLTLFLLRRTLEKGAIALLDEPELHLNPGTCKNLFDFIKTNIVKFNDAQLILTSHSPEILYSTKMDEESLLLHLIDEKSITPILKRDDEEAQAALNHLGVSTADVLFNEGIIYVEGTTDEEFIHEAFKDLVSGYKIKSLGGRGEVEKEIKKLQDLESQVRLEGFHVFIMDNDGRETKLKSTTSVKIVQWNRYTFENHLLNHDVIFEVLKDLEGKNIQNRAHVNQRLKEFALSQISKKAVHQACIDNMFSSISLKKKDIDEANIDAFFEEYGKQLDTIRNWLGENESDQIRAKVKARHQELEAAYRSEWNDKWQQLCNGKDVVYKVHSEFTPSASISNFIKSIIRKLKEKNTEEWTLLRAKMESIFKKK
jgi:predicted ATP-dependent endonuclease of OLD family